MDTAAGLGTRPAWGPPPYGWQLWLEDSPRRTPLHRSHLIVALGFVLGVATLLGYVYFFSAPSEETSTLSSDTEPSSPPSESAATPDTGADSAAGNSGEDPAPYAVTPATPASSSPRPGSAGTVRSVSPPSTADSTGGRAPGSGAAADSHATVGSPESGASAPAAGNAPGPPVDSAPPAGQPSPANSATTDSGTQTSRLPNGHYSGRSGLDPRFGRCADANAAGYGPYVRNDPEYAWYVDTDRDGVACE